MKTVGRIVTIVLLLVGLLVPLSSMAQPGVPNIKNPAETEYQHETHFLTFLGSYVPETAASAKAYYKALDPNNTKPTFADWLVNAGFIADKSQWHPYGQQKIACDLPGCDFPAGTYGDNIINTDSHVIVLNAADLGFVRNQFIRCKPSCTAKNPIIYTYLENYPVSPFAGTLQGSTCTPTIATETTASCFTGNSGYPTQPEADAAIASAITRPLGQFGGDGTSPCTVAAQCIERIADVAFEWAPSASNPKMTTPFGQLYAYIFVHPSNDPGTGLPVTIETTDFPDAFDGKFIIDFVTKLPRTGGVHAGLHADNGANDKFAPNLDGFGFKQHPGVCLMCHGGKPTKLTTTGAYPNNGNINGFRFLPLDNRNLMFENPGNSFSQANQELQIKRYNQAVLLTVPTTVESDGTAKRQAHLREVIQGWYAADGSAYSNDTSMGASVQNSNFIPKGWRDTTHGGTAPVGAEDVYGRVLAPSCRSCHFNRELSLDFGTYKNFHQGSDMLQLTLIAECKQNNPDAKAKFMPAAHLTWQRYWQTQSTTQFLSDGFPLFGVPDELAKDFGMGSVAGYCATNP